METHDVMKAEDAAKRLGVSPYVVWKAIREGELQTLELPGRAVFFNEQQFQAWVDLRRQQGKRDGELTPADGVRVAELADLAGLTSQALHSLRHRGRLRASKVTGKLLVPWAEARRVLEERGIAGDELERLQREKAAQAA